MANVGEITELVNSDELTLKVGADTYIMLTDLRVHVGRTENRIATTDAGALYSYGKGENHFTCTLLLTTPELSSLNTLTQISANGDMTSTAWTIVGNNVSGATKTMACTGILRDYDVKKGTDGKYVEIDIFVRITGDTVAIT
jgi:hypothetical protein